jgi:hypothetical protein
VGRAADADAQKMRKKGTMTDDTISATLSAMAAGEKARAESATSR